MGGQGRESFANEQDLANNQADWQLTESLLIAFYYAIASKDSEMISVIIKYACHEADMTEDRILEIYQIAFDATSKLLN
jgi:alkylhydroperoxidase/carboxymuconolactone decarboxylase family protein YurZ